MANPNITVVGPRTTQMAPTIGQALNMLMRQKQYDQERERYNAQLEYKMRQDAREDMEKRLKFWAENSPDTPIPEFGNMIKAKHKQAGDALLSGEGTVEDFYAQMGELKMLGSQIKTIWDAGMNIYSMSDKNPLINREAIGPALTDIYLDSAGNPKDPYTISSEQILNIPNSAKIWNKQKSMDAYAATVQDTVTEQVQNQRVVGDLIHFDKVKTANKFAQMKDGKVVYDELTGKIQLNLSGEQISKMRNAEGVGQHLDEMVSQAKANGQTTYSYRDAAEQLILETGYARPTTEQEVESTKKLSDREGGAGEQARQKAMSRVKNVMPILSYGQEEIVLSRIKGKPGILDAKILRAGQENLPPEAQQLLEGQGPFSNKKVVHIQYDNKKMRDIVIPVVLRWEDQEMQIDKQGREPDTGERFILIDPDLDTGGRVNPALLELNNWINGTDPTNVSGDDFTDIYESMYGLPLAPKTTNEAKERMQELWQTQNQ